MDVEQYITYQHNVQRFFRKHSEKYAGVMIPLSIATSFPAGTYGFVRALCSKHNTSYAIDPRTPLFQKKWDRKNVRPPHKKMAEIMGEPIETEGLSRNLEVKDFAAESSLNDITEKCLRFQMNFRAREEDARKIEKYKRLLGISKLDDLSAPQFLIPPYFLFNEVGDEWYEVSINCIQRAVAMKIDAPIRPILHFARWPDVKKWNSVLESLKKADIRACWLYPDSYREHESDLASLRSYRTVVECTVSERVDPYALFGGYYAILMHYYGLRGFANGIGYGEWRDSGYHRGGSAMTRVYMLKLHRYLDAPLAQNIIDNDSEYFAGDTDLLRECASTGMRLTDLTSVECLDHFMKCRYAEMEFVSNNPVGAARAELDETCEHLAKIGPLEKENYGMSLTRWRQALE